MYITQKQTQMFINRKYKLKKHYVAENFVYLYWTVLSFFLNKLRNL